MSLKSGLRAFSHLRQSRKKYSLSSTSKLQLDKELKVPTRPCLNLCSFKWLKRRCNLVRYLTPLGSLTLNIDLLLGLNTALDSECCVSHASCDHSDREFGKKEYLKQSVLQLEKGLCFLRVS